MKIIKKGREQDGPAKKLVCTGEGFNGGGCDAILLVLRKDLMRGLKDTPGIHESFLYFKCPCCGTFTDAKWW